MAAVNCVPNNSQANRTPVSPTKLNSTRYTFNVLCWHITDSEGTTSEDELSEEMMDDICNEEEDKMVEITSY